MLLYNLKKEHCIIAVIHVTLRAAWHWYENERNITEEHPWWNPRVPDPTKSWGNVIYMYIVDLNVNVEYIGKELTELKVK